MLAAKHSQTAWSRAYLEQNYLRAQELIAAHPNEPAAWTQVLEASMNLRKLEEARTAAERVFELMKLDSPEAEKARYGFLYNLSYLYFELKDWKKAWELYENRIPCNANEDYKEFPNKRWNGEDLTGKRVFLLPEQGIGDNIMMFRFVAPLRARCERIFFPYTQNLKFIVEQVFLPEELVRPDQLGEGDYDYYLHGMSLPLAMGCTTPESVTPYVPFLKTHEAKVLEWKQKLSVLKGLKVGVIWGGNIKSGNDCNRSLDPRLLRRLAEVPGVQLVALQYREGRYPLPLEERDFISYDASHEVGPWEDLIGAVSACDVFLTIDTSAGHLLGSIGYPTWLMLQYNSDYRWSAAEESSPWYPNHRLFRCPDVNDWSSVLETIAAELEQKTREHNLDISSVPTLAQLQARFDYKKNANLILGTNQENQIVKGKHGYFICNSFDRIISRSMIKYGEYSENTVEFFQSVLHYECVVIEVGSFFGNHTVPLANAVGKSGRVYAFEPIHAFYYMLCGNIAINNLTQVDAQMIPIGDTERKAPISPIQLDRNFNYGGIDIRKFPFGYEAQMKTLDGIFIKEDEKQNLKRLDLVVIDVNGMEAEVLKGSKQLLEKYTPHIYLGNNFPKFSPATIRAAEELGYNLYWHIPKMYNPANDAQVKENIFEGMVTVNMIGVHKKYPINTRLQRVSNPEEYPQRKK